MLPIFTHHLYIIQMISLAGQSHFVHCLNSDDLHQTRYDALHNQIISIIAFLVLTVRNDDISFSNK